MIRFEGLVRCRQLAECGFARLESLSERDLFLSCKQLVVRDFAQVHRPGATRQLFGQQSEAADRLSGGGFRFGFRPLGQLGIEHFFSFVQQIETHCV